MRGIQRRLDRTWQVGKMPRRQRGQGLQNAGIFGSLVSNGNEKKFVSDFFENMQHGCIIFIAEGSKQDDRLLSSKNLIPSGSKRLGRLFVVGAINDDPIPHPLKAGRPFYRGKAPLDSLRRAIQA